MYITINLIVVMTANSMIPLTQYIKGQKNWKRCYFGKMYIINNSLHVYRYLHVDKIDLI